MLISKKAINLIISEEVSSQKNYEKKLMGIIWPGGESGATIGIGYDLGYVTAEEIERDWRYEIGSSQVAILKMFAGLRGEKAKRAVQLNMVSKQVQIPFASATNVFIKTSLKKFGRSANTIYPGLDKLFPDAIGGIVSMVYNRGTKLEGERRTEMKAIVPLVAAQDYDGIAEQIEASKRLWDNGLVQRRIKEAALVKNSNRQYSNDELIEV